MHFLNAAIHRPIVGPIGRILATTAMHNLIDRVDSPFWGTDIDVPLLPFLQAHAD
jgi:hypothetical protein